MSSPEVVGRSRCSVELHSTVAESRFLDHTCEDHTCAAATSVRRNKYLAVSIIMTVLAHGLPLTFVPFDQVCEGTSLSGNGQTLSFSKLLVSNLPLYPMLWVHGCVMAIIFAERKYNRRKRSHVTTMFWLLMNIFMSFTDSFQVVWRCSLVPVFFWIWVIAVMIGYLLYVPLAWLALWRLRILTSSCSKLRMYGEVAFVVCVIDLVVLVTLFAFQMGFHSGLQHVEIVLVVFILSHGSLNFCVIIALENSARATLAVVNVDLDMVGERFKKAAYSARIAALITTISEATTVTYFVTLLFTPQAGVFEERLIYNISWLIDVMANTIACLFFSGIFFSEDRIRYEAERHSQVIARLEETVRTSAGTAIAVATLMNGTSPIDVLRIAIAKFRCVSWEVLATRPDVIIAGGPVDAVGRGGSDLYSLSVPCRLGECDAFISHSWHDDGHLKWEALTFWCEGFKRTHKRYPSIWLDKVCIDQLNIEEDLKCLPIFLAGCNTMFVMSGSTYHRRLWCSVEMLVYKEMLVTDCIRMPPEVWLIGFSNDQCQGCLQGWRQFDVSACECGQIEDKIMFLDLVEKYPGGAEALNLFMRNLADGIQTSFSSGYDIDERI